LLGLISTFPMEITRIWSTAFFVFDAFQILHMYNQMSYQGITNRLKKPFMTLFHHVVTTLLMHGFMFQGRLTGLVIFYIAEIAMLPVLITWRYLHLDQEGSLECAYWHLVEIILYGFLRVFLLPWLFAFGIWPYIEWNHPLGLVICGLYVGVYYMNVQWFRTMLDLSKEQLLTAFGAMYGSYTSVFERAVTIQNSEASDKCTSHRA
jgi:hypothetical protein